MTLASYGVSIVFLDSCAIFRPSGSRGEAFTRQTSELGQNEPANASPLLPIETFHPAGLSSVPRVFDLSKSSNHIHCKEVSETCPLPEDFPVSLSRYTEACDFPFERKEWKEGRTGISSILPFFHSFPQRNLLGKVKPKSVLILQLTHIATELDRCRNDVLHIFRGSHQNALTHRQTVYTQFFRLWAGDRGVIEFGAQEV